jgi:CheY-like chemotaxis protein
VYIIFSVQDTGRGLSDADQKLLFTRFSQASPRTHIDYGGSGLGLFISKRLTQMHGGAIGFSSKAGLGSTFSFYVKSRRSDVSARNNSHDITNEVSARPQKAFNDKDQKHAIQPRETMIAMNSLHILIVEDVSLASYEHPILLEKFNTRQNLVNQRVLAKQLRNIGVQVAVANHGGEALEYIHGTEYCVTDKPANPLSLILMDWEMPVMDGLTCVREIRKLQAQGVIHGHVPVIAVTANVRSEQVKIALDAGMDDLISKPFRIPELEACIQKLLLSTAVK